MGNEEIIVSEEAHENAKLAYLIELVLSDADFEDIHEEIKKLSASKESIREEVLPLSMSLAAIARRLNLHPVLLAFALIQWSEQADLGTPGAMGLDNWFALQPDALDRRREALAATQSICEDIEFTISKLNVDPIDSVKLARKKSGELSIVLDKLIKQIQGELGKKKRLFYQCSRRDIQIFYRIKVKKKTLSSPEILEIFEGPKSTYDLSVLDNRTSLSQRAHSRANEIQGLIDSVIETYSVRTD